MTTISETAATQEELVASCVTLVHHLARQYAAKNSSASLEDLVGEGYIGLVQAAQKFQPGRGVKFSAFATTRIRGAIMDSLRRDRPLSRPMVEKVTRFQALKDEMTDSLGRQPTESELASHLRISTAKLREIHRMRAPASHRSTLRWTRCTTRSRTKATPRRTSP